MYHPHYDESFTYEHWRHGGWYVDQITWPNGGCGCVSRNYADGKWRIACDPRSFNDQPTFKTRTEAAWAEMELTQGLIALECGDTLRCPDCGRAAMAHYADGSSLCGACFMDRH